ncbi:hypothetical protein D9M70_609140 [compost metagenome]
MDLHYRQLAVGSENDDVINIRAIHHKFILFQTVAYKAVLAVYVQLLVIGSHHGCLNLSKLQDLCSALAPFSVFPGKLLKEVNGIADQVFEVIVHLYQLFL